MTEDSTSMPDLVSPKAPGPTQHYLDVVDGISQELEDLADEVERTESFPTRAFELLAENDLLRLTLPEEFGGQGMTLREYFPVLQRVAMEDAGRARLGLQPLSPTF